MGAEAARKLPVLDYSKEDLKPGTSSWISTCKDVRQALEKYGCFIVKYNKVSSELRKEVFDALKELFDLPTETKMKNKYNTPLMGYVGPNIRIPLHESLGIDDATSLHATHTFTNILWPNGNDSFCKTLHKYAVQAGELDQMVTRMIFESYGLEKYYESYVESTKYLLRLLKNRAPCVDESNIAFNHHTDKSFTTILHQSEVNALEITTKDGDTILVELPSPASSFVVIAGDALMAWSNDRVLSPTHRVVLSERKDRYSLGLFAFNRGVMQTPQEFVDEDHPLMYNPFDHIGLLSFYRSPEGFYSQCPIKAYCGVSN